MRRNPVTDVVTDIFNRDTLEMAAGALGAIAGTRWAVNKLLAGTTAWPGMKTAAGVQSPMGVAIYRALIGGVGAYLLRNRMPKLAQGIAIGTAVGLAQDIIRAQNLAPTIPWNGTSAYLPPGGVGRGMRAYTPGVPAVFTGPGSAFITGGAPRSRGMNTMLTAPVARNMVANGAPNFAMPN